MVKFDKNEKCFTVNITGFDLNNYMETLRSVVQLIIDRDRGVDSRDAVENVAWLLMDMIPTGDELTEIIKSEI